MNIFHRICILLKALYHLGPQPVALNALYRLGLASGHYRRNSKFDTRRLHIESLSFKALFSFPAREQIIKIIGDSGCQALLAEADEIAAGKIRLFNGEPVLLQLAMPGKLAHWSEYETGRTPIPYPVDTNIPAKDIKFLWEPARFCWAYTLGRAYHISGKDKYAEAFWQYFKKFIEANPPYLGPHWMSGQEVAIRLMSLIWSVQVFYESAYSTSERKAQLTQAIAVHATRIPLTLIYARSQQNNHLLCEAAGLLAAGLVLPEHSASSFWRSLGWKWLISGFQSQIDGYGEYSQHSTNYHRLMLQVALYVNALFPKCGLRWPRQTINALTRATHWFLALLDPESGQMPNLGANDGAYIFPLTICPYADFRPVAQAAAQAFLNYQLPHGPWDEMSQWFNLSHESPKYVQLTRYLGDHLSASRSWGYLRAVKLNSRPSHADQLHFDLWWRGLNIAQDAGTFLYNASFPWENALTSTLIHNTVTVDGKEQMSRAGRFLYLDWVNAYWKIFVDADERVLQRACAHHYGFWRKGIRHERCVIVHTDELWLVEDELTLLPCLSLLRRARSFRLHWLLPDWKWEIEEGDSIVGIRIKSPAGWVKLRVLASEPISGLQLARAGDRIYGTGKALPIQGWVSPTYGLKIPALSLAIVVNCASDVKFTSEFNFPK